MLNEILTVLLWWIAILATIGIPFWGIAWLARRHGLKAPPVLVDESVQAAKRKAQQSELLGLLLVHFAIIGLIAVGTGIYHRDWGRVGIGLLLFALLAGAILLHQAGQRSRERASNPGKTASEQLNVSTLGSRSTSKNGTNT